MATGAKEPPTLMRTSSQSSLESAQTHSITNPTWTPLHRRLSLNESWLSSFSRSISLNSAVADKDNDFDAHSQVSVDSSLADHIPSVQANAGHMRRGSLDTQRDLMVSDNMSSQRKYVTSNSKVMSWLMSGKKVPTISSIVETNETSNSMENIHAGIPSNQLLPPGNDGTTVGAKPSKILLSLREMNAMTPTAF